MYARRGFAPAVALLLLACSDSTGPAGLSIDRLAGTWELSELKLLLESDTTVQQDLRAATGVSATLVITAQGAATLTAWIGGESPQTESATIALRGDTLVYLSQGNTFEFRVELAARRMTWLALDTEEFADLDGDGTADETRELLAWIRR